MKTSLVAAPKRVEPVKEGAKPSIDNGSKKGQPASGQANQKKWKCVECTFLNEAYTTFCDMCEASKKESPPTAAPAAAKPTPPSSLGTTHSLPRDRLLLITIRFVVMSALQAQSERRKMMMRKRRMRPAAPRRPNAKDQKLIRNQKVCACPSLGPTRSGSSVVCWL
jgi:hypothetical protein